MSERRDPRRDPDSSRSAGRPDALDVLLRGADHEVGALDDFERGVGETLRASHGAAVDRAAGDLESSVTRTLLGLAGPAHERAPSPRRLRPLLAIAAVVLVAVTVGFVVAILRARSGVLASAEAGELRRAGTDEWTDIDSRVSLRSGDSIRASGASTHIVLAGGEVVLHDGALALADEPGGVAASLVRGTMDVRGSEPSSRSARFSIAVGPVRFRVNAGLRSQVRHEPDAARSLVAVLAGRAAVERTGAGGETSRREIAAGRCLVRDGVRGEAQYRVENAALRESLALLRRRWQYYGRVEARRKSTRVVVVAPDLQRPIDRAIRRLGAVRPTPAAEVPRTIAFPPRDVAPNGVVEFLAMHTRDDENFAWASLGAAVRCDLAEVSAIAARALHTMGRERRALEIRMDEAGASRRTRTAVRAALGDPTATADVLRAIRRSTSLEERTWAVLAAGGAGLDLAPLVDAARWVGPKFYAAPWAAASAFAEAVGFACAEATTRDGGDALCGILADGTIALEVRRRFVDGFSRAGRGSQSTHGILLEAFSRAREPALKRAILTGLFDHADAVGGADPSRVRAGVAAFFALLANARTHYTPLAQRGRFLYASNAERPAVEAELLAMLADDVDPAMRAAAARAFVPAAPSSATAAAQPVAAVSAATVPALEAALVDPDPGVRYWTGVALSRHGRRESLGPMLAAFANETDGTCLCGFAAALVRLPGAAADRRVGAALAARLSDEPRDAVRLALIDALGRLGTDLARMVLEDFAASADSLGRQAAERAVRRMEALDAVKRHDARHPR